MEIVGELLAAAGETAAEVRAIGSLRKAEELIARRAERATNYLPEGEMKRRLREHFRVEVWRLAMH